jgi:hypothetical protein
MTTSTQAPMSLAELPSAGQGSVDATPSAIQLPSQLGTRDLRFCEAHLAG